MIIDEETYLDHHGVKGQKWGVRRRQKQTARMQKNINRLRRLESGKGSKTDAFVASMFQIPIHRAVTGKGIKGGASKTLTAFRGQQDKVNRGEGKARDILNKAFGIRVKDLDLSRL